MRGKSVRPPEPGARDGALARSKVPGPTFGPHRPRGQAPGPSDLRGWPTAPRGGAGGSRGGRPEGPGWGRRRGPDVFTPECAVNPSDPPQPGARGTGPDACPALANGPPWGAGGSRWAGLPSVGACRRPASLHLAGARSAITLGG